MRALCARSSASTGAGSTSERGLPGGLRRRADQGRLAGGADPAGVRRLGPRPGRGLGDHGGDQPLRRQLRRLPRPDVQHGHAAAPRLATRRRRSTCRSIASGELRLQSMGVTEPTTGTDTTKIKTTAVKQGDRYVVNGQKVWISRVQHSDLMILLART
ncbi:MAG: acyl-CoA dehydrogenase family protein, partial [Marinilabiliales bacterium]|nr:acyl-CoA dehydrogenase family protein [Marinilabiliales bacterium]